MIAADTNVWARAYLNDDVVQAQKARAALAKGRTDGGVFVPLIVVAELFWVLRSQWKKERVLHTLEHLLQTDGVTVESPSIVIEALKEAHTGSAGFADLLIAQISLENGADEIVTFDKSFGRHSHVRRLT